MTRDDLPGDRPSKLDLYDEAFARVLRVLGVVGAIVYAWAVIVKGAELHAIFIGLCALCIHGKAGIDALKAWRQKE